MSDIPDYKRPQTWRFEFDVVRERLLIDSTGSNFQEAHDKAISGLKNMTPKQQLDVAAGYTQICDPPLIRLTKSTKFHPPGWKPRRDHSGKEGDEA